MTDWKAEYDNARTTITLLQKEVKGLENNLDKWKVYVRETCNQCFELSALIVEQYQDRTPKELAALIRAMKTKL